MGRYNAEFPVGSTVRIDGKQQLERFLKEWNYHHPLHHSQLKYAGCVAKVARVMFYHGGDVLYELFGIPGIWHEACLSAGDVIA